MEDPSPTIWSNFVELSEEAATGFSRWRKSAEADRTWKARLSRFRYQFVPLLAAPHLQNEEPSFWGDVGAAFEWIYDALERPRKRIPVAFEPQIHALRRTLIYLGYGGPAGIDNDPKAKPGSVPPPPLCLSAARLPPTKGGGRRPAV